jgi:ABC-2 type transport system ATP-binding protein
MDKTIVYTKDLSKKYNQKSEIYALQSMDLSINQGTLFGLIGPDGAGKSTTLRILATIIPPTSGQANINGFDVQTEMEKVRGQIGYMPQNFSLYQDLSVIENLNFFAEIQRMPLDQRHERIERMLGFTHLGQFQHRRARNLSGGMKKKLALACALVHNPRVLILDEPSTGVDPVSRRELWEILASVVEDGVTIIVSTPYMDEAERCHKVAILYQGRVIANGPTAELRHNLPYDIVEVKAKPRKAARQLISSLEGIHDWRPVGDTFRITVEKSHTDMVQTALRKELDAQELETRLLRLSTPSMEDVFVYQAGNSRGDHESL